VPISSQWINSGHIYPVQVAQYGLSYFSRWKENLNKEAEIIRLDWLSKDKNLMRKKNSFEFNLKSL
jgi:hypothetical protein